MKTLLKAVCDNAFVASDGKLNIIGIFNVIRTEGFPVTHPAMTFVFTFDRGSTGSFEYDYHIDIADSSGKKIFDSASKSGKLRIGENGRGNLIVNVQLLSFPKEDTYTANLYIGEFKDSIDFDVAQLS